MNTMDFMTVKEAQELFLKHRQNRGCADGTITLYRGQLEDWEVWRSAQGRGILLADVSIADFNEWLAYLRYEHIPHQGNTHRPAAAKKGVAASTLDSNYRTLRAFWRFLIEQEDDAGTSLLASVQQRFFLNDRIPLPRTSGIDVAALKAGTLDRNRAIDEAQLAKLLDACGAGFDEESARNRAIMFMLFESGMRVNELATLTDGQITLEECMAEIVGKGDKFGLIFWGPRTQVALLRYLRLRRGGRGGDLPLFRGCSSRNNGGAASSNLVRSMVKGIATIAGVALPKGSPCHCFRRGFAQLARARGLSRSEVQALLRHDDEETTRLYLGDDKAALQNSHRQAFGGAPVSMEPTDLHAVHRRVFGD